MMADEYIERRRALARAIGPGGVAIIPAAEEVVRNRDTHYPFRQCSDFAYLTGFPEPGAYAVIAPGREEGSFVLFCRPRDREREQWDGKRSGVEGAIAEYGADQAFALDRLDEVMPSLLDGCERLYYAIGSDPALDGRVTDWVNHLRARVRAGASAPETFVSLETILHEMRLRKSPAEIELMRRAAEISAAAHQRLMQVCEPGMNESRLEAEFQYACAAAGARFQAYPPIVGGGPNACTLHYVQNTATLRDGDLVLIDAGCEFAHYASDITRTFPVNGRFSPAQRALYEVVLEAQAAAISEAKPGHRWDAPHQAAVRVLTEGLMRLGILQGHLDELIETQAHTPYYMHRTGHWLGMDVHDVGRYKVEGAWRPLEPGMVLTVEPGLYLSDDERIPEPFRQIGIRIEDDVLITETGNEILSAAVPKDPDAIEALMTQRRDGPQFG